MLHIPGNSFHLIQILQFNFAVDRNRIILPTLAGVPGSDYINGNYVQVGMRKENRQKSSDHANAVHVDGTASLSLICMFGLHLSPLRNIF